MRIIISPAKKMNSDTDSLPWKDLPAFLPDTERILHKLREMSYPELKKLWQCSDSIAQLNFRRLQEMDLHRESLQSLELLKTMQQMVSEMVVLEVPPENNKNI